GTVGDGVTHDHLIVAVGEGRVWRPLGRPPGDHARVDRPEQRAERVVEPLDVAAGQGRGRSAGVAHQGRIAHQDLVRAAAVAEPQMVGRLRVPRGRAGRPVDLPLQRVLAARTDLRDGYGTACAV